MDPRSSWTICYTTLIIEGTLTGLILRRTDEDSALWDDFLLPLIDSSDAPEWAIISSTSIILGNTLYLLLTIIFR
jgi:hypothetical protein